MFSRSPTGELSKVYEPSTGFKAGPNGQQAINPGGPAAIQVEQQLRTDFEKAPEYRGYLRSNAIFDAMKKEYATPGRVADINFVYGLATIFDPDSVVREGERVVIRNAQALPDWLVGQVNRINGGAGLQPEMRAQMLESAGSRISGAHQQLELTDRHSAADLPLKRQAAMRRIEHARHMDR